MFTVEKDHSNVLLAIKDSLSWLTYKSTIWYTQEKSLMSVRYVTIYRMRLTPKYINAHQRQN